MIAGSLSSASGNFVKCNVAKTKAWIPLPSALDFLPNDLNFLSLGFENPSLDLVKALASRETTSLQLSGEAPPHEPRPPPPTSR
jgi:hypothetical protein